MNQCVYLNFNFNKNTLSLNNNNSFVTMPVIFFFITRLIYKNKVLIELPMLFEVFYKISFEYLFYIYSLYDNTYSISFKDLEHDTC